MLYFLYGKHWLPVLSFGCSLSLSIFRVSVFSFAFPPVFSWPFLWDGHSPSWSNNAIRRPYTSGVNTTYCTQAVFYTFAPPDILSFFAIHLLYSRHTQILYHTSPLILLQMTTIPSFPGRCSFVFPDTPEIRIFLVIFHVSINSTQ